MKLPRVMLTTIAVLAAGANVGSAQPAPVGGDSATVAAFEQTLVDVIARAEPAVVAIARTSSAQPSILQPQIEDIFGDLRQPSIQVDPSRTTGAGVIIDPAGLVLTQYLAVRQDDEHTVTTIDGATYSAEIKAADPRSGLALLAIAPQASPLQRAGRPIFPSLPLGDAAQLRKGQFLIVIGDPYAIRSDGQPTASWGTVTNIARKAPSGANLNDTPGPVGDYRTTYHHLGTLLQTDAKLGWSAGGGAVVNLRGELVGLTTTVSAIPGHEQPAGYAIPINDTTRRIIDTLRHGREVEYGLLGVTFRATDLPVAPERIAARPTGVVVQQVYPGSPAARAGLQPNDVITEVEDRAVTSVDGVQLAVSTLPPGTQVAIHYTRGDRTATATARLAKLNVPGKKVVTAIPSRWRGMRIDYASALDTPALVESLSTGAIDPEGCVLVAEVEPESTAWQAGVRPGMFVSHVGETRVGTPAEFQAAVQQQPREVTIRLTRPVRRPDRTEQNDVRIP